MQACEAADGTDVIAAEHSAHPVMGEEIPRNAWSKRHGTDFTGQRLPFGCGVYFKPAVTKYVLDKANARASYGICLGYRLAPGCRWNGEYIVADLTDFVNLDLSESASGQGIHLYEHVTKVVKLPTNGYIFPLKQRYDYLNTTLEGLRHADIEPGDLPEFLIGLDTE